MTDNLQWGQVWPEFPEFEQIGARSRVVPVVCKILVDDTAPVALYKLMTDSRPGTFILESAERDGRWSRWSFIGVSARASLIMRDGQARWLGEVPEGIKTSGSTIELLADALTQLESQANPGLPPLTGGLIGALGWDVLYDWAPELPKKAGVEHTTPDVSLSLVEDLIAVDHHTNTLWLIANAINRDNTPDNIRVAYDSAVARIKAMRAKLSSAVTMNPTVLLDSDDEQPVFRTPQNVFENSVRTIQEAIARGEASQVVISQRTDIECTADPLDVYRVLRTINPSPYMYFMRLASDTDDAGFTVVGSSPETLMRLTDNKLMTFPIGGSSPRGTDPVDDRKRAQWLVNDPKEVSEHEMLIDLSLSDLAKVCDPESLEVLDRMFIKYYSHVMHLTSVVTGTVAPEKNVVDCLAATFPAGTLSGAPKQRAIELIDELEPVRRGIYGGVCGYFAFSGNADLAIAIRTAIIDGKNASVQAGAGVVDLSNPTSEFEETRNKAGAAIRAIQIANRLSQGTV
ncbi:MAG: anthranilate synthase component I [Actinomycetaceae bacterium]|nr:anthranilate synthase component I [Actinomycetaceae bacterium]